MKKLVCTSALFFLLLSTVYAQNATSTIPISIGLPCGSGPGIKDSIMYFTYNRGAATITRLSSCRPDLAAPGLYSYNTSVSFNPADGYLYFVNISGTTSYIWRWLPNTCPAGPLPVYKSYPNQIIVGLDFDASGMGYQVIFTGSSAPYGLALQKVDFTSGTFGPIINIDLQGKQINTQNGDLVITTGGQFLMVWDNLYFSLNYEDYNTATPLKATYISNIALSGSTKLVGLAYAQGKLVGSAGDCGYYDFNIMTGKLVNLTEGPNLQFSTDMTNITSGIGAAKKLVSSTPVSPGVYDLVYDISVENFGDYPVSGFQIKEDLTTMHPLGSSVISNVTTQWVSNPAGIVKNPSFDGVTDKNLIASAPSQTLPVFPRANSRCVLRLKFRLSSVESGVVYYNNVSVTGKGYNNVSLQDSSTNGSDADLNANYKPDDAGENQPTPFSVSVSAELPPCSNIHSVLYNQGFGTGSGISQILPGTVLTEYAAGTSPMNEDTYIVTNDAYNGNTSKFVSISDHTGNTNGRMLLVNADVQNSKIFEDVVNISCVNLKYTFLIYAANAANGSYSTFCDAFGGVKNPKLILVVRNAANNAIIANYATNDITLASWQSYGMKWVMPAGVSSVKIQIYNAGEGGCGNVVAIDDVQFGMCDPAPVVSASLPSAGCKGSDATIDATLSDTTGLAGYLQYQWQSYNNATSEWADISNASSSAYTISNFGAADEKYYRIAVAANGNLGNNACQYVSNALMVSLKDTSAAPAFVSSNKAFVCPGEPAILTVNGGSLGANAVWKWHQQSCSGTYIESGNSIKVYPLATTSYYVRAEGDCNITQCVFITMPQLCILANESVTLRGSLQGQNANLVFAVVSDNKISSFEVERSLNGTDFITVKKEFINDYANKEGYNLKDNLAALRDNIFYYRIKITGISGEAYYSKVLQLSRSGNDFNTTVFPNPANINAKVTFTSAAAAKVEIRLFNTQGQLVRKDNVMSVAGANNYVMNGLDKLPAGIYNVSVTDAGKTSHTKLVIQR